LRAGTIISKSMIQQFEYLGSMICKLGFNQWELIRLIPVLSDDVQLDGDDLAELVEKVLRVNFIKTRICNAMPFCSCDPSGISRVADGALGDDGHRRVIVDASGRIKPIYFLLEYLGSALEDDIRDVWQNPFLKRMRTLQYVPSECRACRFVYVCRGGSRSVAHICSGSFSAPDPLARPQQYKKQLFGYKRGGISIRP